MWHYRQYYEYHSEFSICTVYHENGTHERLKQIKAGREGKKNYRTNNQKARKIEEKRRKKEKKFHVPKIVKRENGQVALQQ